MCVNGGGNRNPWTDYRIGIYPTPYISRISPPLKAGVEKSQIQISVELLEIRRNCQETALKNILASCVVMAPQTILQRPNP